jgi:hypothetical protein
MKTPRLPTRRLTTSGGSWQARLASGKSISCLNLALSASCHSRSVVVNQLSFHNPVDQLSGSMSCLSMSWQSMSFLPTGFDVFAFNFWPLKHSDLGYLWHYSLLKVFLPFRCLYLKVFKQCNCFSYHNKFECFHCVSFPPWSYICRQQWSLMGSTLEGSSLSSKY